MGCCIAGWWDCGVGCSSISNPRQWLFFCLIRELMYRETVISIEIGREHSISVCGGVKSRLIWIVQRFPPLLFSSGWISLWTKMLQWFEMEQEHHCRCYTKCLAINTWRNEFSSRHPCFGIDNIDWLSQLPVNIGHLLSTGWSAALKQCLPHPESGWAPLLGLLRHWLLCGHSHLKLDP